LFYSQQKYIGTSYTMTVALFLTAFIVTPAVMVASRPFGDVALAVALAAGVMCTGLAIFHWMKRSQLTISSIVPAASRAK
jgi:hypothetical protein